MKHQVIPSGTQRTASTPVYITRQTQSDSYSAGSSLLFTQVTSKHDRHTLLANMTDILSLLCPTQPPLTTFHWSHSIIHLHSSLSPNCLPRPSQCSIPLHFPSSLSNLVQISISCWLNPL